MALATYSDLQTAVLDWLVRPDLINRVADFIRLAECDFNRRLRLSKAEIRADLSVSAEYVSWPDDMIELRRIYIDGNPRFTLDPVTPEKRQEMYAGSGVGMPRVYSMEGASFGFSPTPDATYTAKLLYVPGMTLSTGSPTNSVLTTYPDIYLYGSIVQALMYIQDDERLAVYQPKYDKAIDDARLDIARLKFSGGPLVQRPSVVV